MWTLTKHKGRINFQYKIKKQTRVLYSILLKTISRNSKTVKGIFKQLKHATRCTVKNVYRIHCIASFNKTYSTFDSQICSEPNVQLYCKFLCYRPSPPNTLPIFPYGVTLKASRLTHYTCGSPL